MDSVAHQLRDILSAYHLYPLLNVFYVKNLRFSTNNQSNQINNNSSFGTPGTLRSSPHRRFDRCRSSWACISCSEGKRRVWGLDVVKFVTPAKESSHFEKLISTLLHKQKYVFFHRLHTQFKFGKKTFVFWVIHWIWMTNKHIWILDETLAVFK